MIKTSIRDLKLLIGQILFKADVIKEEFLRFSLYYLFCTIVYLAQFPIVHSSILLNSTANSINNILGKVAELGPVQVCEVCGYTLEKKPLIDVLYAMPEKKNSLNLNKTFKIKKISC